MLRAPRSHSELARVKGPGGPLSRLPLYALLLLVLPTLDARAPAVRAYPYLDPTPPAAAAGRISRHSPIRAPGIPCVDDVMTGPDHASSHSVIRMPLLRDLSPGLWFRAPALEIEGLVHRQLPHQSIVRLLQRDGRLAPRRALRRELDVEILEAAPPELEHETARRPAHGRPTPPAPGVRASVSPTGPHKLDVVPLRAERRLRYCGSCGLDRTAHYHLLAWRCSVCGYATQPLRRPPVVSTRKLLIAELDLSIDELTALQAAAPGAEPIRARLTTLRRELVPELPAASREVTRRSWWRRPQHSRRTPESALWAILRYRRPTKGGGG